MTDGTVSLEYQIVDGPFQGRVYETQKGAVTALTLGRGGWQGKYKYDNRYPDAKIQVRKVVREGWEGLDD